MLLLVLQLIFHRETSMNKTKWLERKLGSDLTSTANISLLFRSIFRIKEFALSLPFQLPRFILVCVRVSFPYYLNVSCTLLPSFSVGFVFFILCPSVSPRVQFNYLQFYFQAGCIIFWGFASSHINLFIGSFCPSKWTAICSWGSRGSWEANWQFTYWHCSSSNQAWIESQLVTRVMPLASAQVGPGQSQASSWPLLMDNR